ncbi:hypothetical protein DF225_26480, partial [Escherichia coli]
MIDSDAILHLQNLSLLQLFLIRIWINMTSIYQSLCLRNGFAPIFPDTCHHLTHYWPAAVDTPV